MKFVKIVFVALIMLLCSLSANTATLSCTSATDTQFVPSWGQVQVNQDQYSKYIYQWMYWHSSSRTSWFNQNLGSTFEPDAFFGGPNGNETPYGYFPRNVWYGSGDVVGYWNSDLPTPYQDTAFEDTGSEWAVTVGSAQASLIQSGHVYYTVARMLDGGVSSSKLKLSTQRGVRGNAAGGVDYFGKWNSYGCTEPPTNTPTTFTLPWGANFTAPGCRTYWYKWDISTNQAC
jgi:hypothetical protein